MVSYYACSPSSSSSSSLGGLGRGLLLLLTILSCIGIGTMTNAQDNIDCRTYDDSCNGCLENSPCVWVPVEGCLESCDMIADTSCYSLQFFTNRESLEEICTIAENDVSDSILCNSQSDCTTCTETLLSGGDGTNTCQWFQNDANFDVDVDAIGGIGYCGSGCGMFGCGEFTCSSSTMLDDDRISSNCESYMSCGDCLGGDDDTCGWINEMGCMESCDIIADVGCYNIVNFNRDDDIDVLMTADDICTVAANDIANIDLCSSHADCTTCIETGLVSSDPSSGSNTCQWFSDGNFCSSECNMIGCGETACTADNIGGIIDAGSIDNGSGLIMEAPSTTTDPSSPSVVSSADAKKYSYSLVWTSTLVLVASCLL
jgi:hypothetical protein